MYWSNITETGVIEANGNERTLGVPVPDDTAASVVSGNLGSGRYQYTFSAVEGDGRESGTPQPGLIELPENSGLSFTFSAGLARNFWLTEANGEELYLAATVLAGETSFVFRGSKPRTSIGLDRLLMAPPSPWNAVDWYRSSLLFAVKGNLEWTNPFDYELRDEAKNYMVWGEAVHVIASLRDGFYIGTETAHWWLSGPSMDELDMTQVADYGAIPGTKQHIKGEVVGSGESTERIPVWSTQRGFVVGLPGGTLRNVHENKVDFPGGLAGTALYRSTGRQNHYIARVVS